MQIEWTQCEIRKCKTSIHTTTTTTAAQWPGTFVWHENNNKKEAQKKKSSKRKEQTITMCVSVCFAKRQFCAQFAITHSSSHSIAVRRRSLIECLPAGERERERTRTVPAWHARSLYLVMLPHVLALPSIHSLSLSCSLSWPAAQAATKAAAAAAATSFQLRWHSTHSSLVRWRLCRQAALSSSLRVFPCALLN